MLFDAFQREEQIMTSDVIRVKTASCEMDYFKFGEGDKVMVILPGLSVVSVMGSKGTIADAYAPMANDFTIYVMDRRADMPNPYTVYDMAEDTVTVFEELGLKDIYLFGASQGGMIAMTIAISHPELVAKLALGSPSASVRTEDLNSFPTWVDLAEKRDAAALYQAFAKALYPEETYKAYKDVLSEEEKVVYNKLRFDEDVINGRSEVVEDDRAIRAQQNKLLRAQNQINKEKFGGAKVQK